MDTVLGLSMTPTTVGLVLVEGDGADGATKHHDVFEVRRGGFSPVTTSEFVAEALSRTQAIAGGQRLQSIGVTWSDDAAVEASLLLDSLADSGFDNIVPIRLPEATEAFARAIGQVIGSEVSTVCVVEPDAVVALAVDSNQNSVQTAVSYQLETDQDLIGWLADVLSRDGWRADGLVLLGSGDELDIIARRLEQVLGMPVFAPAEAELALARGAALASVNSFGLFDDPLFIAPESARDGHRSLVRSGPVAMLVGGVLTFVVSASAAAGIALLPDRGGSHAEQRPVVNTAETASPRPVSVPLAPPPPQVLAPPPQEPPLPAPPLEAVSEPVAQAPVAEEPAAQLPADVPADVPTDVPAPAPDAPPADALAPPPPVVQPSVPPVTTSKPSLRTRILERLADLRAGNG
ncbi:DUF7159 family protein [Candidatus Mycolicibacterium alkanivorans]|uniref:DUF7159 domain-containing protein n=1 Tax=Candidatus Mycolicibacterium alkanivorans TaxID=2954114 RepID=A0ABS9YWW1_9MYCO|nr:hypothetical protein [Candidatus Mycolicibacterium alkanivorans]MCI4675741.1 hypothetical protein [Candidatus Mycolicibacterium alkanivorans]